MGRRCIVGPPQRLSVGVALIAASMVAACSSGSSVDDTSSDSAVVSSSQAAAVASPSPSPSPSTGALLHQDQVIATQNRSTFTVRFFDPVPYATVGDEPAVELCGQHLDAYTGSAAAMAVPITITVVSEVDAVTLDFSDVFVVDADPSFRGFPDVPGRTIYWAKNFTGGPDCGSSNDGTDHSARFGFTGLQPGTTSRELKTWMLVPDANTANPTDPSTMLSRIVIKPTITIAGQGALAGFRSPSVVKCATGDPALGGTTGFLALYPAAVRAAGCE